VVFLGSTPIGGTLSGWVGQHLNARVGLAGGGVIAVLAGLAGLAALSMRVIRDDGPGEQGELVEAGVAEGGPE